VQAADDLQTAVGSFTYVTFAKTIPMYPNQPATKGGIGGPPEPTQPVPLPLITGRPTLVDGKLPETRLQDVYIQKLIIYYQEPLKSTS